MEFGQFGFVNVFARLGGQKPMSGLLQFSIGDSEFAHKMSGIIPFRPRFRYVCPH
jgi:hypothetical protein